ncbi:MAG: GNAT family N-acetyltransferase [Burkholderiales bacterium]|nr:GNAT family N-acetyltransferase [Burkholderiales bacterium]
MNPLRISCDKSALDIAFIHRFLATQSSWAKNIPLDTVQRSITNSLCFGGYLGDQQVAFARVISDYATFANLVDVFVIPEHRGRGFSKRLMEAVTSHPDLQGLRRFTLATADAHGLYAQFGFTPLHKPLSFMERHAPAIYTSADGESK